jgi:hypothetical protein
MSRLLPSVRAALLSLPLLAACSSSPAQQSTGGSGGHDTGGSSSSTSSSGSPASSSSSGTASSSSGTSGGSCSHALPEYTNGNGSVTFYTFSMGSSAVNCGFDILGVSPDVVAHVDTGAGKFFGAMNTADYDTAATCGACVEVTRDGTKKVVVTIVDQCPTPSNPVCTAGHIDLSVDFAPRLTS